MLGARRESLVCLNSLIMSIKVVSRLEKNSEILGFEGRDSGIFCS